MFTMETTNPTHLELDIQIMMMHYGEIFHWMSCDRVWLLHQKSPDQRFIVPQVTGLFYS